MTTRAAYRQFIDPAYHLEKPHVSDRYQESLQLIRDATPLFGYSAPRWMLNYGATCAFLFARSGDPQLAFVRSTE